jgi:glutamate/tyrosine decarboxylase-like PLP-dependent enzyme
MSELRDLLHMTADLAADFYDTLDERPVFPHVDADELRATLGGPLPSGSTAPGEVVEELAAAADPGIVAEPGGRYFGFVVGGSLPATLAADWLTTAWDQDAGLYVLGPAATIVEEIAGGWLKELFGLPPDASFAFTTGCQMANFTGLAAARHRVLRRAGWDVESHGLAGAPPVRIVVGGQRHGTIDRALRMLGLGAPEVVEADDQGRMRVDELGLGTEPTIVCAQAGEVNTGAFDDLNAVADRRDKAANAWLHVDGAFGLWARVPDSLRYLAAGVERADSWATDAHKWLNVPYDCGVVFCADGEAHSGAFSTRPPYLMFESEIREPFDWNPESSRRARGFPVYAALRSLGRSGIADLVERCCALARTFAAGLGELGAEVLNEVVLNQVLFRFATDEQTNDVLRRVQQGGAAWMGGTTWDGRAAIRFSVSNWQTTPADVERTLAAYAEAVGSGQVAAR